VSGDSQAVAVAASDAPQSLNGCDRETATELSGASVRLSFGGMFGFAFDPACVVIAVGTELTFVGNFVQHPLKPGRVDGDAVVVADNNPIQSTSTDSQAGFVFSQPGSYRFFCEAHVHERMLGAVFVGPAPMMAPGESPAVRRGPSRPRLRQSRRG
jgi:plastocyanin